MGPTEEVQIVLAHDSPKFTGQTLRSFWIGLAALILCFCGVLFDLVRHAAAESLHSHILLIPFVSAYLIWQERRSLPAPTRGSIALISIFAGFGLLALVAFFILRSNGSALSHNDYLSLTVFAFCAFLFAICTFFLGNAVLKAIAFPLGFLIFLVPLPDQATATLEIASQYASAEVYSWMMNLSGATYYREGRTFVLPSLTIIVAQECSGIRSSLVLFITSLIAAHMFLRSTWKKLLLAFLVFPLGIARNALRIFFLSMASAHWNPDIIHSPLHHRGGPIFFALSLVPFFMILWWLRKSDCQPTTEPSVPS